MRPSGIKIDSPPVQKKALRAVALIELIKGIFVLLMGLCALLLVHQDIWLIAESLLALLRINPDRHLALVFLDFADNVTDARLWAAARIAFAYAALRFIEAYGLWRGRAWAEWVAVVSGTLLLPLEIRELQRGVTLLRSAIFVGNLMIVLYMLHLLRYGYRQRRRHSMSTGQADVSRTETRDPSRNRAL
jgi:uncharacterized membrane protein (DUF2068 family)